MGLNKTTCMKFFSYIVIGVVAIVVVAGLWLIGSPAKERMRKIDERRVQHLQQIQSEILEYWRSKGVIPSELNVLNDDLRGFRVPSDPRGAEYEYNILGSEKFALCAVFELGSEYSKMNRALVPHGGFSDPEIWDHAAGRVCFERTIDKDRYKPYYEKGM